MKLYATVASERASKGQGGNKYIDIDLAVGSTSDSNHFASLRLNIIDGVYTLWLDGEVIKRSDTKKGEKQKGKCEHDLDNYGKCCDCGKWVVTQ